MKIVSWNVNGIRAVQNKGLFEPFLAEHDPDILCLQETKANHEQIDLDWPQYEEYWCSAERKGYSGTALFSKHEPLSVVCDLPAEIAVAHDLADTYGDAQKEGRIITAEFEPFYVSTVYTPNTKGDLSRLALRQRWDAAYLAYMKQLSAQKPVVFCGDLNVAHTELDLARPKQNKGSNGFTEEERAGFDNLLAAGFTDTLRHFEPETPELYTWWSHYGNARARNVGWRIDYVLVSGALVPILKNAKIHPAVPGSDHCPVSIELSVEL